MNLALDIGNSRTKAGVFDQGVLKDIVVWRNPERTEILTLIEKHRIRNCIYASVRKEAIDPGMFEIPGLVIELTNTTPLPVENQYRSPETLGLDRIAAIVGTHSRYPREHCLVIDAGTCITIDLLNAEGQFVGGNIAPGVDMRLLAMHHMTGRLPKVEKALSGAILGSTTPEAMQNGAILGVLLELAGYMEMLKTQYTPLRVVVTGGDAQYLAEMLKTQIFVHPNLVLEGLDKILEFNVEHNK